LLVIGAYILVMRAFGIPQSQIPYTGAVFVMGLSMLGSVVPTPGGATGPFHAAAAAALVFLGVDRNLAASAAIVLHLVIFLPAVFFGLFYILKEGIAPSVLMHPRPQALADSPLNGTQGPLRVRESSAVVTKTVASAAGRPTAFSPETHREEHERS